MNYEIFIWLEPIADLVQLSFGLLSLFSVFALVAVIVCCIFQGDSEEEVKKGKRFSKLLGALIIVGFIICLVSSPFANFTNLYKKTLIYRGINSTLVDKGVDTADKALDVLNAKLDKEMSAIKAEKE